MSTIMMTETKIKLLKTMIEKIMADDSKISFSKAWRKAAHKSFGIKVEDSTLSTVSKFGKENTIKFLNEINVSRKAEDINMAYVNIGHSCMTGKNVGKFYELFSISCINTVNSRGMISENHLQFTKTYGEDHALLSAVLLTIGFKLDDKFLYDINHSELLLKMMSTGELEELLLSNYGSKIVLDLEMAFKMSIQFHLCRNSDLSFPMNPSFQEILSLIVKEIEQLDFLVRETLARSVFKTDGSNKKADLFVKQLIVFIRKQKPYAPYLDFLPR